MVMCFHIVWVNYGWCGGSLPISSRVRAASSVSESGPSGHANPSLIASRLRLRESVVRWFELLPPPTAPLLLAGGPLGRGKPAPRGGAPIPTPPPPPAVVAGDGNPRP